MSEDEKAIKRMVIKLTPRTCQGCESENLRELVAPMANKEVKRYICEDCGHISYYWDYEENWRVG